MAGAFEPWSEPATWGGEVPEAGEVVTIPAGVQVLLDSDPPELDGLIIRGQLVFADKDLELSSSWILLDGGSLSIGSPSNRHTARAVITLSGSDESENIAGMGTKFLGVMNGGRLELHGARAHARNWTRLAAHAPSGATSLQLMESVDWFPGDQLVIAPSGFDPHEAEEVTVTASTGAEIEFFPPLEHDHWGELQMIRGHSIDQRAEVGCLTRNILIRGDAASQISEFGGHLMFGPGTTVHVEGVEFSRMGQKGHPGRYPIHWHITGDRHGDYARGNSIHHSYHRAVVVHGTSRVLVENNISYDVWSHAFVPAEDGTESGNRFIGNLAVLTRQLALADYAFPASAAGASLQSEGRPAAFWLKGPDHFVAGNHAAGVVDGMGFLYDGPGTSQRWAGEFVGNTAHACSASPGTPASRYPGLTKGYGLFMEDQQLPEEIVFREFNAYKNTLSGAWLEGAGQRLVSAALADNRTGAILFQSSISDGVIVGQSGNTIGSLPEGGAPPSGGLHLMAGDDLRVPRLRDIDFIDQPGAGIVVLGTRLHPLSSLQGLTFSNTRPCRFDRPSELTGGFTDLDGSVMADGIPVYVHGGEALAMTPETTFVSNLNAWVTPLAGLQFLSLSAGAGSSDEIGYTLLMGADEFGELPETSFGNQPSTVAGYIREGQDYFAIRFDPLPEPTRMVTGGGGGGSVLVNVPSIGEPFIYDEVVSGFGTGVPDFSALVPQSQSASEVFANDHLSWFEESADQGLWIRLPGDRAIYLFDRAAGGLDISDPEKLWRSQQFGYGLVQSEGAEDVWGSLSDPDRDGINNRLEFFMATDPLRRDQSVSFDPAHRCLSFPRNPAAWNLAHLVSYSYDLQTWSTDPEFVEIPQPDGTIRVIATAPDADQGQLFMRLHVLPTP